MPYRALDGRINFVLFSGGIVRRVYPDPASMNGWSVEQVYYPVSGTRYVRIVSCPSQGTDGTDALLVYGFGTNPATMNVVRYAVGASGGLQARDSLPTTHQPGGFPLVPEISLPSGYYVPEFALADGGGTQWDGVGLVLRSLSISPFTRWRQPRRCPAASFSPVPTRPCAFSGRTARPSGT